MIVADPDTYGADKLWCVLRPIPIELDDDDDDVTNYNFVSRHYVKQKLMDIAVRMKRERGWTLYLVKPGVANDLTVRWRQYQQMSSRFNTMYSSFSDNISDTP